MENATFDYKDLKIISMSPAQQWGICLAEIFKMIAFRLSQNGT
jgi:gamma-glutamyltranspeptidase/glutathione hydrolase